MHTIRLHKLDLIIFDVEPLHSTTRAIARGHLNEALMQSHCSLLGQGLFFKWVPRKVPHFFWTWTRNHECFFGYKSQDQPTTWDSRAIFLMQLRSPTSFWLARWGQEWIGANEPLITMSIKLTYLFFSQFLIHST